MRWVYDANADALHVTLHDGPSQWQDEIAPGVILDYDADDRVIGVELLDARALLAAFTEAVTPRG